MPGQHKRWVWHLAALAVTFTGATLAAAPVELRISQGRIAGEQADGVRIFKGIPFAMPPVGELRWRDPRPPASWPGVRDATAFGARCMQAAGNAGGRVPDAIASLAVSEDCLYLNVWTAVPRSGER